MSGYKLYDYFRSSASFRVRIALHYKGISYTSVPIHLRNNVQQSNAYLQLNPQGLVPMLETKEGIHISQSLSIIEYLEETHHPPSLLPNDSIARAKTRSLAQIIACDIHPLNNLRVLTYLTKTLHIEEAAKQAWYQHWVLAGLKVIEEHINEQQGPYTMGAHMSLADLCLIPQIYNALRFNCDITQLPKCIKVYETCLALACFQNALPEQQADFEI